MGWSNCVILMKFKVFKSLESKAQKDSSLITKSSHLNKIIKIWSPMTYSIHHHINHLLILKSSIQTVSHKVLLSISLKAIVIQNNFFKSK